MSLHLHAAWRRLCRRISGRDRESVPVPDMSATFPIAAEAILSASRWRPELQHFLRTDASRGFRSGAIVFTGSSTIRLWPALATDFAAWAPVVGRGVGGCTLAECATFAPLLTAPHAPRQIVLYAGDNDLIEGAAPQDVLAAFRRFCTGVRAARPALPIAFVSIKRSPARAAIFDAVDAANALIRAETARDTTLDFIDIDPALCDAHGAPRAELFLPDGIHLNAAGYAGLRALIALHLLPAPH